MGSIESFRGEVDDIYGTYLDACTAFVIYKAKVEELQRQSAATNRVSLTQLDQAHWRYGNGDPNTPEAVLLHAVTQGGLKARLADGGRNAILQARMALVSIYQLWEDRYRAEIAEELGLKAKDDLTNDMLGDLRLIRIGIIHHGGIGKAAIEKCKVLKWFKAGDPINVDKHQMRDLVQRLDLQCREWATARDGTAGVSGY